MPIPSHLLERAYQLINANQLQNAELVLDAVVRVDPQNVEAWKTYLMISHNQIDLDWVKERILKTRELGKTNKAELIEYYEYLTGKLSEAKEYTDQVNTFTFSWQEGKWEDTPTEETDDRFELLDVFDYPAKIIYRELRTRPRPKLRRRSYYNPINVNFVGNILKATSQHPIGRKLVNYLEAPIALVNDYINDPGKAYERFSQSPHFKTHVEVSLFILFILGVRMMMVGSFLGYILLGTFVIGSWRWLSKYTDYSTNQTRVFMHENVNSLPEVKEKEEEGQESSGEKPAKNGR